MNNRFNHYPPDLQLLYLKASRRAVETCRQRMVNFIENHHSPEQVQTLAKEDYLKEEAETKRLMMEVDHELLCQALAFEIHDSISENLKELCISAGDWEPCKKLLTEVIANCDEEIEKMKTTTVTE